MIVLRLIIHTIEIEITTLTETWYATYVTIFQ